jgi:ABC-type oligopeptide transport system ATPase subunit
MSTPALLKIEGLTKDFTARGHRQRAVDNVSFELGYGETFGLIGESGSGKSTLGRMILRLESVTDGKVVLAGEDITQLRGRALKNMRRQVQAVFQDPYSALNPRMKVGDLIAEPLVVHGFPGGRRARDARVAELLAKVGLPADAAERFPHQFSGGQRQRVGIARALALSPRLIVADEPVTALDVSIQAQVINLFQDLQRETGISLLFIAHDLNVVRHLCHRVGVMWRGRIVESGPTADIFADPRHSYTRSLLSAIPIPDPDVERHRRHEPFIPPPQAVVSTRLNITPEHWILT